MSKVDVLIVNYKTPELTLKAVESVLNEPETNRVIVVENGSPDDSASRLEKECAELSVQLIVLPKNVGFGGGNNSGATAATAPYLFLLNSDAQLLAGSLSRLVKALESRPQTGVVAPAVYLDDGVTLQHDTQGMLPTAWRILTQQTKRFSTSLEPEWLSGVTLLVRREEFLALGGFAKEFFMYMEDVDLCRRYQERGLGMYRELEAGVIHLGGRSKKTRADQRKSYYAAQDTYLERSGTWLPLRLLVKLVRSLYQLLKPS